MSQKAHAPMLVQIDDFYTDNPIKIKWLLKMPIEVRLSVLLSKSDRESLKKISGASLCVHGWNHFCEPKFGYWEARHLLETAESWQCFDRAFVMPWNRMPTPGFMKAIKEMDFSFITPYKRQYIAFVLLGCRAEYSVPDLLLHPPDLLLRLEETKQMVAKRWKESR